MCCQHLVHGGGTWNPTPSLTSTGKPSGVSAFTAVPPQTKPPTPAQISPPKHTPDKDDKAHTQRVYQSFQQHHEAIKLFSQPTTDKHGKPHHESITEKDFKMAAAAAAHHGPYPSSQDGPPHSTPSPGQLVYNLYGMPGNLVDKHGRPIKDETKHGRQSPLHRKGGRKEGGGSVIVENRESASREAGLARDMAIARDMAMSRDAARDMPRDAPMVRDMKSRESGMSRDLGISRDGSKSRDGGMSREGLAYHGGGSITLGTARPQGGSTHTVKAETRPVPLPHHAMMPSHHHRVSSPHPPSNMQPLDLQYKPSANRDTPATKPSDLTEYMAKLSGNHQPHVSTTTSVVASTTLSNNSRTRHLIQQGLVPNPLHATTQQPTTAPTKMSITEAAPTHYGRMVPSSTGPPPATVKRRQPQDGEADLKKPRIGEVYTDLRLLAGDNAHEANTEGTPPSYMDSFKSFVEKTVHSAYMKDQDDTSIKKKAASPVVMNTTSSSAVPTNSTITSMAVTTNNIPSALSSLPASSVMRPAPPSTPGGSSTSSLQGSSVMDTINRVANGLDTDSDTLSVPSPVQQSHQPKNDQANCGGGPLGDPLPNNHKKFKKAWLQRYSDEDKKVSADTPSPSVTDINEDSSGFADRGEKSGEGVKDCYVNCSYISPTKDGASKSPISMLKDLTRPGTKEEEGCTSASASEAESMHSDTASKRKSKTGKRRPEGGPSKKIKREEGCGEPPELTAEVPPPPPLTPTPLQTAKKRKNKSKVKTEDESGTEDQDIKPPVITSQPPALSEDPPPVTKPPSPSPSPPRPAITSDCETKMAKRLKERMENNSKRESPSSLLTNKPLNVEPLNKLKKTLEPFSQDDSCFEITPKLMKCRECRMTPNQKNKKMPNIFCRFYAFRRLKYSNKGYLSIAGFSEPSDADADDIELWMPLSPVAAPRLNVEMAKYIMANVGDRFCELVEQEKGAMAWVTPDTKIAWKRAVQGVREMCDACDTTLFNFHWVCHKCGFVVCLDCYRLRMRKVQQQGSACDDPTCTTCEGMGQRWLSCSANRQPHEPDKLMITQIIPSDVLWVLGRQIHEVREKWGIQAKCPCVRSRVDQVLKSNGMSQLGRATLVNGVAHKSKKTGSSESSGSSSSTPSPGVISDSMNGPPGALSPLSLLAEAAASRESEESKRKEESADGKSNPCSTLRDLLTKKGIKCNKAAVVTEESRTSALSSLDEVIQNVAESIHGSKIMISDNKQTRTLAHYVPPMGSAHLPGRDGPIPCHTLAETSVLFPKVSHSWLDHGRLLRLLEPQNPANIRLFQQQWQRAQPVLVSSCDGLLNMELWKPATFSKDFGNQDNDLVNCQTNVVIVGHKMKVFWDNFEHLATRLKDSKHKPMILKLKDWPPSEDFADLMPERFNDLMQGLPLPEYTQRNGVFNLASRLPEFFVKPDLGPKMYNAYGSALAPKTGSTNIHLDMSDAVNIMIYVGIPDDDNENQEKGAWDTMLKAGCCESTMDRVRNKERPGALWHIFDPQDADKIRDLLNKVAKERGEKIETHHDPIHDQSWYLDEELRARLLEEYGVQGYTIVQFLGDAVFIPCGAPHQVRNLHSCIKVAEDFVSPENMDYCFKMTQEFRQLSDSHSNHEDKLQIKNMIFHAMKDAVAVLRENEQQ